MGSLSFDSSETEKIKESIELYKFTRKLLICNETIDVNLATSPEIMYEIAIAFDFFNQALSQKLNNEQYNSIQELEEMFNHTYISTVENIEWLQMEVRECIQRELKTYSNEAISECIPNYYSEMKPSFFKYQERVNKTRSWISEKTKDIKYLDECKQIVEDLLDIRKEIIIKLNSLKEYDLKEKAEKRKKLTYGLGVAVIATIIAEFFMKIFD